MAIVPSEILADFDSNVPRAYEFLFDEYNPRDQSRPPKKVSFKLKTLFPPTWGLDQIRKLCNEAVQHGHYSVSKMIDGGEWNIQVNYMRDGEEYVLYGSGAPFATPSTFSWKTFYPNIKNHFPREDPVPLNVGPGSKMDIEKTNFDSSDDFDSDDAFLLSPDSNTNDPNMMEIE